jgi:hypothetical protein
LSSGKENRREVKMRRKLNTVLLNKKEMEAAVAGYLNDFALSGDAVGKVEPPWSMLCKSQARQIGEVWGEVVRLEKERAEKIRDRSTGKTHKTALKHQYWQGRADALLLFDLLLAAMRAEVGG